MKIFCKQPAGGTGGYTIIETMIAISLFIAIVMAGMTALINANLVHQKSGDMRSIIDNLSFVTEEISRNLRVGYDFHCINDNDWEATEPRSCAYGGGISFKTSLAPDEQWVYYVDQADGRIYKSTQGGAAGSFIPLTSEGIYVDPISGFSVLGAEPSPPNGTDNQQPFVTIRFSGSIMYKDTETPFSVQTSASQRLLDIPQTQ